MKEGKCMRNYKKGLCPVSFGVAMGVISGLYMAVLAWAGWIWGFGLILVDQYSAVYYGLAPTFMGGVIGGFWGLIDGFIFGFVLAFIYNLCLHCCKSCKCCKTAGECRCSSCCSAEGKPRSGDSI
jgi:hypothetical protein